MKEDSIDDLKKKIADLEYTNKLIAEHSKLNSLAIQLLVTAGHLNEDKLEQARELARSIN